MRETQRSERSSSEQIGAVRSSSERKVGPKWVPRIVGEGQAGYYMVRGNLHGPSNLDSCLSMGLIAGRKVRCGCAVFFLASFNHLQPPVGGVYEGHLSWRWLLALAALPRR